MSEFALKVGLEFIAGANGSYILREWLPRVEVDSLLDTIAREVARGSRMEQVAYVEAMRNVREPSSDKTCDVCKNEENEEENEEEEDEVELLISDASFWIPELAVTALTPRTRIIKSHVVWNHTCTIDAAQSTAVAQKLRKMARQVDWMLDDMAAEYGDWHTRDSAPRNNYVTVRYLADRQRVDMRHMEPDTDNNVVCLLALGGERTLCLRVWGMMDPDEPAYEIPLTHGCMVVLVPDLLANGCSYAVRPRKGGRTPPHAHGPHVLLEIRAVERFRQVDASLIRGT